MKKVNTHKHVPSSIGFAAVFSIALIGYAFVPQHRDANIIAGLRYEETSITTHNINPNDFAKLYEFEKVGLKQIEEKRYVETTLGSNNEITTTITIAKTNAYEEGMVTPGRIVMDSRSVTVYNNDGKVMTSRILSPEEQEENRKIGELAAERGLLRVPEFNNLETEEVKSLESSGASVRVSDTGYSIQKDNKEFVCNLNDKFISVKEFASDGKIISEIARNYVDGPSGRVPDMKQEVEYTVLPSGVQAARVTHTVYSNYQKF